MKNIFIFLSLFFGLNLAVAGPTGLMSTAHREAMTANGGLTNQCSGGQFVNNPAGIHCDYAGVSESFGSTNISSMSISLNNQNVKDLQKSNNQIAPGLSVFVQSFHDGDTSYGFGGSVFNVQFEKSFEVDADVAKGVALMSSTMTEVKFGGYYAKKIDHLSFGAVIALTQEQRNDNQFLKYKYQSSYITQQSNKVTLEQFVVPSIGAIWDFKDQKYAVTLSKSYSLSGHYQGDSTEAYTIGTFNEGSKDGVVKSDRPWGVSLGGAIPLERSILSGSLSGETSSKTYDGDESYTNELAPIFSVGVGYEYFWSNKISVLAGARKYKTFSETENQPVTSSDMYSAGLVRKYKGVEIGTGVGFTHFYQASYNRSTQERSNGNEITRADLTFSSSFTY
jgi:hypothetical protein